MKKSFKVMYEETLAELNKTEKEKEQCINFFNALVKITEMAHERDDEIYKNLTEEIYEYEEENEKIREENEMLKKEIARMKNEMNELKTIA